MKALPELTDDAVIDLAREGGVAWIPKLAGERRFALAQLSAPRREQVCDILKKAMPLGAPPGENNPAGRGDQRYFRIQISYQTDRQSGDIVILIPEQLAPPELEHLWREGECE